MIFERLVQFANTYSWYDHVILRNELRRWQGRVLDVGCGSQRLRRLLGRDAEYVGVDLYGRNVDVKVDIAMEQYPFPDSSFDYAICNAVLEHVADPLFVMQEIRRVLKPGGTIYVSVPFLQPYHADPEDYRRYTRVGLAQLLEQHGFEEFRFPEVNGMFLVIEYLAFFELMQFLKRSRRFFNPARWVELLVLIPVYAGSKMVNLFSRFFRRDGYASPGVSVIARKR